MTQVRNVSETVPDSVCKKDKGVQLRIHKKRQPAPAQFPAWRRWGQRALSRSDSSCLLFLTGEQGLWNSLFFDLTGNFLTLSLSYSPHGHGRLLSGIISALWAQAFVWCPRHQIYCTLSEWPKEAGFLLLKTPLARMTKGGVNYRHKGREREEGTGPVRGDYRALPPHIPPRRWWCGSVQGCAASTCNSSNRLRARKEIDTVTKGWPAFVDGLPVCAAWEGALLETVTPLYPRLHLLTDFGIHFLLNICIL